MRIRIVSTPQGEAPEEVRRGWIGLELPLPPKFNGPATFLGTSVLAAPQNWIGQIIAMLTGRARIRTGYSVETSDALRLLVRHNPDAAEWWYKNTPRLVHPGRYFVFAADCCEEVE
ncbi:MAG: hypothetical protein IT366_01400 [Candidatus Hydrogenedentes bacterium]|nr:hypothetical protein [Candidatus Hydrogenedentota bacterium]